MLAFICPAQTAVSMWSQTCSNYKELSASVHASTAVEKEDLTPSLSFFPSLTLLCSCSFSLAHSHLLIHPSISLPSVAIFRSWHTCFHTLSCRQSPARGVWIQPVEIWQLNCEMNSWKKAKQAVGSREGIPHSLRWLGMGSFRFRHWSQRLTNMTERSIAVD